MARRWNQTGDPVKDSHGAHLLSWQEMVGRGWIKRAVVTSTLLSFPLPPMERVDTEREMEESDISPDVGRPLLSLRHGTMAARHGGAE